MILFPRRQQRSLRFTETLFFIPLLIFSFPQNPRSLGGDVASDGDFLIFEGNRYSRKGFLFKSFAMSAVVRVLEGLLLMTVGSREGKLSLPPSVQAPEWWVIWICAGLPSKSGVSPGQSLYLSSPLSWAVTLTFLLSPCLRSRRV